MELMKLHEANKLQEAYEKKLHGANKITQSL